MTNLIVAQPFVNFARTTTPPPTVLTVSPPHPEGWARVAAWAEEVLAGGLTEEAPSQMRFFSVLFLLLLAVLVASTGLFAGPTTRDGIVEKEANEEGAVEKDQSNEDIDTTVDNSSVGSLSRSEEVENSNSSDGVHAEDSQIKPGVQVPETISTETIPALLTSSSMSAGGSSGDDQVDSSESFEDCVTDRDPASFDLPDRVLCEQVLCKIAELNNRLDTLSLHGKMNSHQAMPLLDIHH